MSTIIWSKTGGNKIMRFIIPVGNISTKKAKKALKAFMDKHKEKIDGDIFLPTKREK